MYPIFSASNSGMIELRLEYMQSSQLPQIPKRLQYLINLRETFLAAFAEVGGERGGIGAGFREQAAEGGDLLGEGFRPLLGRALHWG